jgi:hypothetical protein
MDGIAPFDRQQDSATYARTRDAAILSLLDDHPVTAAMLVRLGLFARKKKALERLRLLARRHQVRLVGTIWRKAGRPENVYCRWRPKGDQLLHEVELTEVCLRLSVDRLLRGPAVSDRAVRPDAEIWINGELLYLELDRGTMRLGQIERRFARYDGCPHVSLWVCPDRQRVENLRGRAETMRCTALFATFADVLTDPQAEIWQDFAGGRVALPACVERPWLTKGRRTRGESPALSAEFGRNHRSMLADRHSSR